MEIQSPFLINFEQLPTNLTFPEYLLDFKFQKYGKSLALVSFSQIILRFTLFVWSRSKKKIPIFMDLNFLPTFFYRGGRKWLFCC